MSESGARSGDDDLPLDERSTAPAPATHEGGAGEADLVREGAIIDRKYRVERVLGEGGMGVVVAAEHLELGGKVALKFVRATRGTGELLDRMRREARIAFRLKSDHVARLLDLGTLPSGAPYIVMEYLEGRDLAAVLADRGPLPIPEAVDCVLQACEAMAEAHRLGIVHRDLKPSNLFLTENAEGEPHVKVLDFGIAKARSEHVLGAESITKSSQAPGSPLYMSPEQVRGAKDIDARSDIWSLGVILHELVAGVPPFEPGPASALAAAIAADPPEPLRAKRADAPVALEAVVLRCLSRKAAERYRDVHALASALAPFAPATAADRLRSIASVAARAEQQPAPGSSGPQPALPGAATTQSTWNASASSTPRRARVVVAAAIVGAAALSTWMIARSSTTAIQRAAPGSNDAAPINANETSLPAPAPQQSAPSPDTNARASDAPLPDEAPAAASPVPRGEAVAPPKRSAASASGAARVPDRLAPAASSPVVPAASTAAPSATTDIEQRATSRRH